VVSHNHKINLNITWSFSLFYHFWSFIKRHTFMNNTYAVFSGTTLPCAFALLQKVINLLKAFVSRFIDMFTLPYSLIQLFFTYRTFTGFVALNTDDLRTPFFFRKPSDSLLFHIGRKPDNFMLNKVSMIRFPLCIGCNNILTHSSSSLSYVFGQL
jgi:hypothetical protein